MISDLEQIRARDKALEGCTPFMVNNKHNHCVHTWMLETEHLVLTHVTTPAKGEKGDTERYIGPWRGEKQPRASRGQSDDRHRFGCRTSQARHEAQLTTRMHHDHALIVEHLPTRAELAVRIGLLQVRKDVLVVAARKELVTHPEPVGVGGRKVSMGQQLSDL